MIKRLVLLVMGAFVLLSLTGGIATVLATDSGVVDPQGFDPGIFLTAAGALVAGVIQAGFIQVLKRFWPGLENGVESAVSVVLAAVFVAIGFISTGATLTVVSAFMLFLAWLNIAGSAKVSYDVSPVGLKTALKGG